MARDGGGIDLERVLAEITATVAENTASGVYSQTLEDELRSHFARILDRHDLDRFGAVWNAVDDLEALRSLPGPPGNTASRIPGGELVHKATGRLVDRQLASVTDRNDLLWQTTILALRAIAAVLDQPVSHTHVELVHELDTLQDRLAALERHVGRADAILEEIDAIADEPTLGVALQEQLADDVDTMRTALERLLSVPKYSTVAFDDASRGDRASVLAEYGRLADRLATAPGPVVDLGSGRGELLQLLHERAATARGVDIDPQVVAVATALGLDVAEQDAVLALEGVDDASLGAITMIHLVEHLPPSQVFDLVKLAHTKLAPGGLLVIETPNPQSLYAHARALWLDPTHLRPVHPSYLEFLLAQGGFEQLESEWTAVPPEQERLLPIPGDDPVAKAMNENVRRLNDLVFAAQNYRVTATR